MTTMQANETPRIAKKIGFRFRVKGMICTSWCNDRAAAEKLMAAATPSANFEPIGIVDEADTLLAAADSATKG